tara:strand:+ start:98 stop:337 length:240 start_codon:yes stop_codon:yes gene_type:complete
MVKNPRKAKQNGKRKHSLIKSKRMDLIIKDGYGTSNHDKTPHLTKKGSIREGCSREDLTPYELKVHAKFLRKEFFKGMK